MTNTKGFTHESKKYQVIYADPPWSYNDKRNKHPRMCGGALSHYETMPLAEIKALPLASIVAESAVLFLWVTFPLLKEGLEVLDSWGFKYKTLGFSWVKTNKKNGKPFFGIGYYTKSNCECCLLGVRGKTIKPATNSVSSVIISPRREHSRKPTEAKMGIELLYPTQTKIELFAREKTPGWDVWGNEVESDIPLSREEKNERRQSIINAAASELRRNK